MKRKHLSIVSPIIVVLLLPSLVLAGAIPWTIDTDGNLTISESGKHYHVTQSNDAPASYWIKVNDGVETTITLDGVHLSNMDHSPMDLGNHKDTKTTIILKGENSLKKPEAKSDCAALRIGHGTLRIEGDGKLEASTDNGSGVGAGIGSNRYEAMQGTIQIAGKTQITASAVFGAGIGSGLEGEMSGELQITDQARVTTIALMAVGIGAGQSAAMSGKVQISAQAQVDIVAALGIGSFNSGISGSLVRGSIRLEDEAKVKIQSHAEQGIGAGLPGEFRGKIEILDKVQLINQEIILGGQVNGKVVTIGGGPFTTDDPEGHYKISTGATINGIKAENAQVLVDHKLVNIHMVDGKAQNYEAVEPPPEPEPPTPPMPPAPKKVVQFPTLVGLRTLRAGRVSVGPVGPKTTGLLEEASSAFASLQGEVLYQGELRFVGEEPAQAFVLSFHLGSEYAGRTVQIQQVYRGESQAHAVVVSEAGLASVPVRTLGDFAVTVQP